MRLVPWLMPKGPRSLLSTSSCNDEEPVVVSAKFSLSQHPLMQNAQSISMALAIEIRNLPRRDFQKKYDRADIREFSFRIRILRDENIHAGPPDLSAHRRQLPFRKGQTHLFLQGMV